ncbi:hypothetical protein DFJ77DRAFT_465558 [Powellomyces hirtus]|nr:hypothetical protein DFJ77DRAFT_465558 [Powellomyces hirtus]
METIQKIIPAALLPTPPPPPAHRKRSMAKKVLTLGMASDPAPLPPRKRSLVKKVLTLGMGVDHPAPPPPRKRSLVKKVLTLGMGRDSPPAPPPQKSYVKQVLSGFSLESVMGGGNERAAAMKNDEVEDSGEGPSVAPEAAASAAEEDSSPTTATITKSRGHHKTASNRRFSFHRRHHGTAAAETDTAARRPSAFKRTFGKFVKTANRPDKGKGPAEPVDETDAAAAVSTELNNSTATAEKPVHEPNTTTAQPSNTITNTTARAKSAPDLARGTSSSGGGWTLGRSLFAKLWKSTPDTHENAHAFAPGEGGTMLGGWNGKASDEEGETAQPDGEVVGTEGGEKVQEGGLSVESQPLPPAGWNPPVAMPVIFDTPLPPQNAPGPGLQPAPGHALQAAGLALQTAPGPAPESTPGPPPQSAPAPTHYVQKEQLAKAPAPQFPASSQTSFPSQQEQQSATNYLQRELQNARAEIHNARVEIKRLQLRERELEEACALEISNLNKKRLATEARKGSWQRAYADAENQIRLTSREAHLANLALKAAYTEIADLNQKLKLAEETVHQDADTQNEHATAQTILKQRMTIEELGHQVADLEAAIKVRDQMAAESTAIFQNSQLRLNQVWQMYTAHVQQNSYYTMRDPYDALEERQEQNRHAEEMMADVMRSAYTF